MHENVFMTITEFHYSWNSVTMIEFCYFHIIISGIKGFSQFLEFQNSGIPGMLKNLEFPQNQNSVILEIWNLQIFQNVYYSIIMEFENSTISGITIYWNGIMLFL